ncbi:MAG TPA: 30S ribosomal protein S6 [Planctomycetes bacterium]|nr:30S ribosomal protein S6 [Planctomycetota bacterium]
MNTYEAMLLLDNREVKKGWDGLKEKVDGVLKKHGAEIIVAKRWDERKLAYEIKKQRRATYYLAYFKAPPESLAKMNFDLKLSEPILRHLILRVEEVPAEAFEPEKEFQVEASSDSEGSGASKVDAVEEAVDQEEVVVEEVVEAVAVEEIVAEAAAPLEADGTEESSSTTPESDEKSE